MIMQLKYLLNLNIPIPYNPAIPLLCLSQYIHPPDMQKHADIRPSLIAPNQAQKSINSSRLGHA